MFIAWLVARPAGDDLAAAAKIEIGRLSRYRGDQPGPRILLGLFEELLATFPPMPRRPAARPIAPSANA